MFGLGANYRLEDEGDEYSICDVKTGEKIPTHQAFKQMAQEHLSYILPKMKHNGTLEELEDRNPIAATILAEATAQLLLSVLRLGAFNLAAVRGYHANLGRILDMLDSFSTEEDSVKRVKQRQARGKIREQEQEGKN